MNTRGKKIVLATGEYPPNIGGPSIYVLHVEKELRSRGFIPIVVTYGLEKKLPSGIRHLVYAIKLFFKSFATECIWVFDTYSVGVPAVYVARILRKKVLVRIGGDFLWENYVNRTEEKILLSEFYQSERYYNQKEKIIYALTKHILKLANKIIFTTEWQKNIWLEPYKIETRKVSIIENAYTIKPQETESIYGLFSSPSRASAIKNKEILREAIKEVQDEFTHIELDEASLNHEKHLERVSTTYATVIPSLSEVSPNLLLDSLAFVKPFILTKDSGYAERFKNCGVLVDPRKKEEIVAALKSLMDKDVYESYKENIRKISLDRNYENVVDEFIRITDI